MISLPGRENAARKPLRTGPQKGDPETGKRTANTVMRLFKALRKAVRFFI